jgi:hypothetical protein
LLDEDPGGQRGEGHAVAAVSESKRVPRVAAMRSDVGKAVGRHREQPFPRRRKSNVGQRRIQRLEILAQHPCATRELVAVIRARLHRMIGAAEQQLAA